MLGTDLDELETGDRVTQDGLMVLEVTDPDAERGFGKRQEGVKLQEESGGEEIFKSDRQMSVYFESLE